MIRFKRSFVWSIVLLVIITVICYKRSTIRTPTATVKVAPSLQNVGTISAVQKTILSSHVKEGEGMKERLAHVRNICSTYNIMPNVTDPSRFLLKHPPAPQYSVFFFNTEKRQAFCPIYKSASTSMLYWMLSMQGIDATSIVKERKRQISDVARESFPSIDYPLAQELLGKSIKWMVVRHPFERLLSAYRDKLENSTVGREHGTLHFYEKYGKKIVSKYRKEPSNRLEPTFREFVDYIIDTNLLAYADDHWIPYFSYCTPCLVDYDVIIKFETFERDARQLMQLLGQENGPEVKHTNQRGRSRSELVISYYKQLDYVTALKLYDKYRLDFELFNYGIRDFLSIYKRQ